MGLGYFSKNQSLICSALVPEGPDALLFLSLKTPVMISSSVGDLVVDRGGLDQSGDGITCGGGGGVERLKVVAHFR